MPQALDKQIGQYLSLLHEDEKKSLLSVIKSFLSHRKDDHVTIDQYNKELDQADTEHESGDYISHEEMIKLVKKW